MYDKLRSLDKQLAMPSVFIADEKDVAANAPATSKYRKLENQNLTQFELDAKKKYEEMLDEKRPHEPHHLQSYVLGQNPSKCFKASNMGIMNTFTHADKHVWLRSLDRLLTAKEKFVAHGFPMTENLADILGVPAP